MADTAYATEEQLAEYLSADAYAEVQAEATRLLVRASEAVDEYVRMPFDVDADTGLPSDADIASTLADACCAQVEYMAELGEEHDVDGQANREVSIGHLSLTASPKLAPRAARILSNAGLTQVPDGYLLDSWWR